MPKQPKPKKKKKIKNVPLKTKEERIQFSEKIKKQFIDMGCYPGQYGAAGDFFEILDDYVETGDAVSGKISFPECPFGGRDIFYLLSNKSRIENIVHFLMKSSNNDRKNI